MASSEKICFRWNDFETNVSSAFREIREEKDFFDVTLACDDDNQIQAHKVIIAACSPFFRNILRKNTHPSPLLYLKGVKYKDLVSVLKDLNKEYKWEDIDKDKFYEESAKTGGRPDYGLYQNKVSTPAVSKKPDAGMGSSGVGGSRVGK